MLNLEQLRYLSETGVDPVHAPNLMTLDECVKGFDLLPLDEAYYGRNQIKEIQEAMDTIVEKSLEDPTHYTINGSPENAALQAAFRNAFGFNRVTIYWRSINTPFRDARLVSQLMRIPVSGKPLPFNVGPFTIAGGSEFGAPGSVRHGTNRDGFYNREHNLNLFISTDQCLITEGHLTSEEMVAVMLHEVGHNFDFTLCGITGAWAKILAGYIIAFHRCETIGLTPEQTVAAMAGYTYQLAAVTAARKLVPEVLSIIMNLDDFTLSVIPPVRTLSILGCKITGPALKLLRNILLPTRFVQRVAYNIQRIPVHYLENFFLNKSETYADSFAAQYGYGAELGTGLAKFTQYNNSGNMDMRDSFLAPIYDLNEAMNDFVSLVSLEGHGTIDKRFHITMDTLDRDLAASNLSKEEKDAIRTERDRIQEAYDAYMNASPTWKNLFTSTYRKMVNSWYAGRNHLIVPNLLGEKGYAN